MATERCEAYAPGSTEGKDLKYYQRTGPGLSFISRKILGWFEHSDNTWAFHKEHLDNVQERIKMRQLFTHVLPVQDADDFKGKTQPVQQREYKVEKASVRRPHTRMLLLRGA